MTNKNKHNINVINNNVVKTLKQLHHFKILYHSYLTYQFYCKSVYFFLDRKNNAKIILYLRNLFVSLARSLQKRIC